MSSAREEILARIRQACSGDAESAAASYAEITRQYQQAAKLSREEILGLLTERLIEYDAHVYRARETEIAALCRELFARRGAKRIVVPGDLPGAWQSGAEFVADEDLDARELDRFDGVMTAATLAIAETGTIVLQNAHAQGRRAISLVPDYHLCVVREQDVVETVVEGMRLLEATRHLPTTLFSGPSATADIEMTRIKGVHGPRFVDIVILGA
ncbi:LutC/YkgG family protein [Terracidiphilus gabretensis]|jgi:L-lactate dehydrogenase complex protein LldG|uniref:LutC/YkgG family protein n=1 Tax=Terracidiphilus gabretensis TaxID=1577687 RepID=UPI00071B56FB|nr:lactate utilization protein C [Terracidiphilus gabretensis]